MFKKIILLSITLVLLIGLKPVQAQIPGEGLTISPPIFELKIAKGEVQKQTIKITNPTTKLMEVYPLVMNFKASGEGGEPAFYPANDEEASYSLANWISFRQTKLALTPEQAVEFEFQIKVPSDAEPGGHYGVVFFATEPPKPERDTSQVAVASMIGSLILVRVPGAIVEKASLEEFSAPHFVFTAPQFLKNLLSHIGSDNFKNRVQNWGKITLVTRVANLGNVHFKPKGEITIKNWRDKKVTALPVNSARGNVLPDSIRKFEEKWQTNQWAYGRFSASLNLAYGESEKNLNSILYFWVIPWWLIVILILILVLIITLVIRHFRRRQKKSPKLKVQLG